eukprot:7728190-Pyramimonas_sp.AAC.1
MRCMIVPDLDVQVGAFKYAQYGVVADDVQFIVIGTVRFLADRAPVVAAALVHALNCSAQLPVSVDPNKL